MRRMSLADLHPVAQMQRAIHLRLNAQAGGVPAMSGHCEGGATESETASVF